MTRSAIRGVIQIRKNVERAVRRIFSISRNASWKTPPIAGMRYVLILVSIVTILIDAASRRMAQRKGQGHSQSGPFDRSYPPITAYRVYRIAVVARQDVCFPALQVPLTGAKSCGVWIECATRYDGRTNQAELCDNRFSDAVSLPPQERLG